MPKPARPNKNMVGSPITRFIRVSPRFVDLTLGRVIEGFQGERFKHRTRTDRKGAEPFGSFVACQRAPVLVEYRDLVPARQEGPFAADAVVLAGLFFE
jgi:hypothetical protein